MNNDPVHPRLFIEENELQEPVFTGAESDGIVAAAELSEAPLWGGESVNIILVNEGTVGGVNDSSLDHSDGERESNIVGVASPVSSDIEKWSKLKNVARKAAIAVELGAGPVRYGGFLAILKGTGSVPMSVGYLAGSTLLTEGAGVYAVADVLERNESKFLRKINDEIDKRIDRSRRLGVLGKAVISNYIGVPAMLAATHREEPERTKRENIKRGMMASVMLTGAVAVQGVLIAEGATNITEPKVAVPTFAALGCLAGLGKRALNRFKLNKGAKE